MESANTALISFITQDQAHASGTGPPPMCTYYLLDLRNALFASTASEASVRSLFREKLTSALPANRL